MLTAQALSFPYLQFFFLSVISLLLKLINLECSCSSFMPRLFHSDAFTDRALLESVAFQFLTQQQQRTHKI